MIVVLDGRQHGHEHFKFEDRPTRILIQTKERGGGMYGRGRNKAAIYQDTGRYENGCRVYSYVRNTRRNLDGLVETKYA